MMEMSSVLTKERFEDAIAKTLKLLGYDRIKYLQSKVIWEVIKGHDVFAVLPTGFRKSFCYGCLPLVFDEIYKPPEPTIVCVILPLVSIIEDQVCPV